MQLLNKFLGKSLTKKFDGGKTQRNFSKHIQWKTGDYSSLQFEAKNQTGILNKILSELSQNDINIIKLDSRYPKFNDTKKPIVKFNMDIKGQINDANIKKALDNLKQQGITIKEAERLIVPWFPNKQEDFDYIGKSILGAGAGIQEIDHPGFNDIEYRKRREGIISLISDYRIKDPIPRIQYNEQELQTWDFCWKKLNKLYKKNACDEFNWTIDDFIKNGIFKNGQIPQLEDVSQYLKQKTGWRLMPVKGLLSSREFLNGLAFKIFHSTQYLRHSSVPLYTPEPDLIHELLGHAPMFAHQDFADFSQEIGLASLGASEREIRQLGTIYWFTIEFGLCREHNQLKAYGAGILSSVGELEYCVSDKPKYYALDPHEIAQNHLNFPISSMQPYYFVADSFQKAKSQIIDYCDAHTRGFDISFNQETNSISVYKNIQTREELELKCEQITK